jgi:hypothetical protein
LNRPPVVRPRCRKDQVEVCSEPRIDCNCEMKEDLTQRSRSCVLWIQWALPPSSPNCSVGQTRMSEWRFVLLVSTEKNIIQISTNLSRDGEGRSDKPQRKHRHQLRTRNGMNAVQSPMEMDRLQVLAEIGQTFVQIRNERLGLLFWGREWRFVKVGREGVSELTKRRVWRTGGTPPSQLVSQSQIILVDVCRGQRSGVRD